MGFTPRVSAVLIQSNIVRTHMVEERKMRDGARVAAWHAGRVVAATVKWSPVHALMLQWQMKMDDEDGS
jgi:hypothetical protein